MGVELGIEVLGDIALTDAAVVAAEAGFEATAFDAAVITAAESSIPGIAASFAISCVLPGLLRKPPRRY